MGSAPSAEPQRAQSARSPDNGSSASRQTSKSVQDVGGRSRKSPAKTASYKQTVPNSDDIVFETFHHKSGRMYMCMYTNGTRFYLDATKGSEWAEFPFNWYNEGILVTDEIQSKQEDSSGAKASADADIDLALEQNKDDDREGVINIPNRGTFQTYVFEHRRNIHCYYDPDESAWIKLPISWEMKTPLAVKFVKKLKNLCPTWSDERDILAALRASNYNTDDCMNTYLTTEGANATAIPGKGGMQREKSMIQQNESESDLKKKITRLETLLREKEKELEATKSESETFKVKVSTLETSLVLSKVECEGAITQLNALKTSTASAAAVKPSGPTVKPETVKMLWTKVKDLKKSQMQMKAELDGLKTMKTKFADCIAASKKLKGAEQGKNSELEELRTLYRREALQRKLLYNQLQEIRGNIRVFCRVRKDDKVKCAVEFKSDQDVVMKDGEKKHTFQFDKAFNTDSSQEEVFAEVCPIITSCIDGYNISIMAYGQTGSGKTHTMQGPPNSPGVNVRAIKELLKNCAEKSETTEYKLEVGMVEIYNENVQDLLSADVATIEIRATGTKVSLPDLTWKPVKTEKDIITVMDLGASNRKVASTKMNSQSSRSHLMVMLTVQGKDKVSGTITRGTLTLVDLAGSERVGKTEATGARLTEAAFINKSLTALGQIFTALRQNSMHVPYRNSKLTHILQPSLGGDAKAVLFVACSPDPANSQESVSSMQFGGNARQVSLGQAKKNVSKK